MPNSKDFIKIIKISKKEGFEDLKVLNQSPISAVFQIVWLPGDHKTALTWESLKLDHYEDQINISELCFTSSYVVARFVNLLNVILIAAFYT